MFAEGNTCFRYFYAKCLITDGWQIQEMNDTPRWRHSQRGFPFHSILRRRQDYDLQFRSIKEISQDHVVNTMEELPGMCKFALQSSVGMNGTLFGELTWIFEPTMIKCDKLRDRSGKSREYLLRCISDDSPHSFKGLHFDTGLHCIS